MVEITDGVVELLEGEGDTLTTVSVRRRITCDECGEPAYFKHTYLVPRARTNPISSAYGHDDCTWCADEKRFTCKTCRRPEVEGFEWCSTFKCERFPSMFLEWVEVSSTSAKEAK